MLEQERDRAVGAEVAAELGECVPHVGHGARAVVGHAIDHDRRPAYAVAFVADLLVVRAFESARAALDRALYRVLGQVLILRLVHGETQPRIRVDVAAAQPRGDGDFLDETGEDFAALGVLPLLAMLDVRPLAMTRHADLCECASRSIADVRGSSWSKMRCH